MWGTWWEWGPRLNLVPDPVLFYLGYMALWEAIENPDSAADLTAVCAGRIGLRRHFPLRAGVLEPGPAPGRDPVDGRRAEHRQRVLVYRW